MDDSGALERELAERTRDALHEPELDTAVAVVCRAAVEAGLCSQAGVLQILRDRTMSTAGATDAVVQQLDELQQTLGEGPCIQAAFSDGTVQSDDVGTDQRWPRWGPAAARLGVGGVVSVHLYSGPDELGALNLYQFGSRSYSPEELEAANLIGAHASIALAHFRDTEHLWKAIDARHRIGQAQGILMERFNLTAEASFALLRRLSQEGHVKLHVVADQVVRTRCVPGPRSPSSH